MKWYNYKCYWIDILKTTRITFSEIERCVYFRYSEHDDNCFKIEFDNLTERDAEFEKIKELMGIRDYMSRCC